MQLIYFISLLFLTLPCRAEVLDPFQAAQGAVQENLQKPSPDPDGRIQTLNKKGAMSPRLDNISETFVKNAAHADSYVLEIGAGYGLACIEALKQGAKHYVANDLDIRHLKILARDIKEINVDYLNHIKLVAGMFPSCAEELSHQSYDAILIARVLHFMTPFNAMTALRSLYTLLKPGGRIYAVMLSPYVKGYASFIPEFEKRIRNKVRFPGYVENLAAFADKAIIPEKALKNMEKPFLFFDIESARTCFEEAGFKVEKLLQMPLAYQSQIWQLDGRENVGVIAQKPL